jgi:two-component sensor histidine kinase
MTIHDFDDNRLQGVGRALSLDLMEEAPVGIALTEGPKDIIVFANRTCRRIAGGRPIAGRPLAEVFPAATGADNSSRLAAVDGGEPEATVAPGPGQEPTHWDFERVQLHGPDSTRIGRTLIIAHDVTARVRARREAAAGARQAEDAQRLFERLLVDLPTEITIAEPPDVTVRLVTRFGQELLQRPLEDLAGLPAERHPEQWRVLRPDGTRPRAEELPLTRATRGGEVVVNEPWLLERADGERLHILCNAGPIRDAEGAIRWGVIAWRDVTDLKLAEERLRERNERLQLLTEVAEALIATPDPVGMIREIFRRIAPKLDLDACFSFLVDDRGEGLRLNVCVGIPEEVVGSLARLEFGQAVCGTAALTRRPIHASAIQSSADPMVQLVRDLGLRAYACNPLLVGDRLLGTLSFGTRGRDAFSDEDLALFRTLAHHVALAHERLRVERIANEAAEQRRLALEAAELGTWSLDLSRDRIDCDARCRTMIGKIRAAPTTFEDMLSTAHPEDRDRALEAYHAAIEPGSSGIFDVEMRVAHPDGAIRWIASRGQALFEGEGAARRVARLAGITMDVTERKRADEQQRLLLSELDHRIKNLLNLVQALTAQTGAPSRSVEEFRAALAERLAALARAHDLLLGSRWRDADLRALVEQILEPYRLANPQAIVVEGAPVGVPPRQALVLSLILHELATNAAKYGALSAPRGRVEVTWRVPGEVEGGWLTLE